MKLKVDFNGVSWLLTRSRTASSEEVAPALNITKGGSITLNKAFVDKYYKKKPKQLYFQIGWVGDDYFLFVSRSKQEGFYAFNTTKTASGYVGTSMEARKYLGSRKMKTTYKLVPAKLQGAKLRCFKLEVVNAPEA